MPAIRVGLIGISTNSDTGWAAKAHLLYLLASSRYRITAICNTSIDSAQRAIEHIELPKSRNAYGSAEEMAKDPDVDLAVCVPGVEHHCRTLMPLLEAGKNVLNPIDNSRKKAESFEAFEYWFSLIASKIEQYGIEAQNIYNMDEKGSLIGSLTKAKRIFPQSSGLRTRNYNPKP
jgi:hypothetical protein